MRRKHWNRLNCAVVASPRGQYEPGVRKEPFYLASGRAHCLSGCCQVDSSLSDGGNGRTRKNANSDSETPPVRALPIGESTLQRLLQQIASLGVTWGAVGGCLLFLLEHFRINCDNKYSESILLARRTNRRANVLSTLTTIPLARPTPN